MPSTRRLPVLALAAALSALGSPTMAAEPTPSPAPEPTVVAITAPDEPGLPLHIDGLVLDAASGTPVTGAEIYVYQTDDSGEYEPTDPNDESTARLRGQLTTDAEGRFAFRTILPGEYPGQPVGNRHIHVHSVAAEGYEPTGFVILFDDNVRDAVRAWAQDTGFGRIIETSTVDDVLVGSVEIPLEPVAQATEPPPA